MIEGLRVQNFKSLKNVEVELDDFTVLVGQNNSGKSALLESIMYLKEATSQNAESANNVSDPNYINYSFSPKDIFHRSEDVTASEVTVAPQFDTTQASSYRVLEEAAQQVGFNTDLLNPLWIGASLNTDNWSPVYESRTEEGDQHPLFSINQQAGSTQGTPHYDLAVPFEIEGRINVYDRGVLNLVPRNNSQAHNLLKATQNTATQLLDRVYFITDNRDIDKQQDDPQEFDFVGHEGERTVAMLHALRDDEEVFNRIVTAISNISHDIGDLSADMYGKHTRTELADADTGDIYNIVASGAGLRRLLPIIVQVASAEEGSTVMIEEPELSVYPRTQERLVGFLLEAVTERGIQIIISTHSHPLIWKVQNMVDGEVGTALEFSKVDGESHVEQKRIDRMVEFEEYYGDV